MSYSPCPGPHGPVRRYISPPRHRMWTASTPRPRIHLCSPILSQVPLRALDFPTCGQRCSTSRTVHRVWRKRCTVVAVLAAHPTSLPPPCTTRFPLLLAGSPTVWQATQRAEPGLSMTYARCCRARRRYIY